MLIIDKYAYTNNLKNMSPKRKFGYSMGFLVAALINKDPIIFISIILLGFIATVFWAKIPLRSYLLMLATPYVFILTSMVAIIVSFSPDPSVFLRSFDAGPFYIGITTMGLQSALTLFLRAMASISCLYFLTLTTPMDQQIYIMNSMKIPKTFLELYALVYRFIFIFLDESVEIYRAQEMRFGYNNLKNSYKSLSVLIRILFTRVMNRYKDMEIALDSKLYNGDFHIEKQRRG